VTVTTSSEAGRLLAFVQPLLLDDPTDEEDADAARPMALDEEAAAELSPVSKLIHAFRAPSTDDQCRILNTAHRQASSAAQRRSPFALVPVVFECLPLIRQIAIRVTGGEMVEVGVHKLLVFVATIVQSLVPLAPGLALRLALLCAHVADSVGEEADAYEFFTLAFTTYEEEVSDSKAQLSAVTLAAATLHHCVGFEAETYDTLATKTTQYSARLLKKPDQCRAVTRAALLFAPPPKPAAPPTPTTTAADSGEGGEGGEGGDEGGGGAKGTREPRRVLECLQRALKIADSCKVSATHTPLFVEILDAYLYHYATASPAVLPSYVASLLLLIEQQLAEDDSPTAAATARHFANCQVRSALIAHAICDLP